MTIQEAHRQFRFIVDKADGVNYPDFRPEEIDLLLNIAYKRYIKQRYGQTNPKRLGVEENQKRMEDLKNLIKPLRAVTFVSQDNTNIALNSYRVALANDHWFMIQEDAIITYPGCNTVIQTPSDVSGGTRDLTFFTGREVDVIPITHLEYNKVKKDPFREPDKDNVLRLMYKEYVELLIPSVSTLLLYKARYVKKPTPVSLGTSTTFETSDHTHDEIIDLAVQIALENIEAKRQVTFDKIINTNE